MDKLELAYAIALVAHKGQVDKVGVDYINHPLTVSNNCQSEDEKIVALLHDVLEDTKVTKEDLLLFFDSYIVEAVCLLTHKPEDSYMDYLAKIKANPIAKAVKIQDLKHNMDLSRFETPSAKDYERVEKKYKPALEFLLS
jgi:(p)ppGpp synthase/HD superfamily hydrolase